MTLKTHFSRVFFAIDIPQAATRILEAYLSRLKKAFPYQNIKWSPLENCHITLAFLGVIHQNHIANLIANAGKKLENFNRFSLTLDKIELFPSAENPKVISLKIEPHASLNQLAFLLRQAILDSNYPVEEREFRAHLTLARLRHAKANHFNLQAAPPLFIPLIPITQIKLFESKPSEGKRIYFPLAQFPLNLP